MPQTLTDKIFEAVRNCAGTETGFTDGRIVLDRLDVAELRTAIDKVIWEQWKQPQIDLALTDEVIEAEAKKRFGEVTGGMYMAERPLDISRFIKGAKWARDVNPKKSEIKLSELELLLNNYGIERKFDLAERAMRNKGYPLSKETISEINLNVTKEVENWRKSIGYTLNDINPPKPADDGK